MGQPDRRCPSASTGRRAACRRRPDAEDDIGELGGRDAPVDSRSGHRHRGARRRRPWNRSASCARISNSGHRPCRAPGSVAAALVGTGEHQHDRLCDGDPHSFLYDWVQAGGYQEPPRSPRRPRQQRRRCSMSTKKMSCHFAFLRLLPLPYGGRSFRFVNISASYGHGWVACSRTRIVPSTRALTPLGRSVCSADPPEWRGPVRIVNGGITYAVASNEEPRRALTVALATASLVVSSCPGPPPRAERWRSSLACEERGDHDRNCEGEERGLFVLRRRGTRGTRSQSIRSTQPVDQGCSSRRSRATRRATRRRRSGCAHARLTRAQILLVPDDFDLGSQPPVSARRRACSTLVAAASSTSSEGGRKPVLQRRPPPAAPPTRRLASRSGGI